MNLIKLFTILVLLHSTFCKAQTILEKKGTVSGQIRDSVDLASLSEATVAVYMNASSALLNYQLTNSFGRFKILNLPINSDLKLVVSYVGYTPVEKIFRLTKENSDTLFKNLLLSRSVLALQEVVIRQPPMVMRGDTLIFNVSAFESKPNAVIGDLIKDLPGIIIWGDSKITVNGKPVSRVLVGGKVFFSGDPAISLGNIPTEAVKAIQVIPDKFEFDKSRDTTVNSLTMNIELKAGHKKGAFSKLEYGFGNNGKYEGVATFASFSEKAQLSLGGNINNVNKQSFSIGGLLAANTFKNGGITSEIKASDFSIDGLHTNRFGGAKYNRNWNSRILTTSEYHLIYADSDYENFQQETALLTNDFVKSNVQTASGNSGQTQDLTNNFEYRDSVYDHLVINTTVSRQKNNRHSSSSRSLIDGDGAQINQSTSQDNVHSTSRRNSLVLNYDHRGKSSLSKEDFSFGYELENTALVNDRNNETYLQTTGLTRDYSRNYSEINTNYTHQAKMQYLNLNRALRLPLQLDLSLNASYLSRTSSALVNDFGVINNYLTNRNKNNLLELRPSLAVGKNFIKADYGKRVSNLFFNIKLNSRHFSHVNNSDKMFRTFRKEYAAITPEINIHLSKRNVNKHRHVIGINYNTDYRIPGLDQLVPLVDSTQLSQYYFGNIDIKPEYVTDYSIFYNFAQESVNGFALNLKISHQQIRNFISDSVFYDAQGLRNVFLVNVKGYGQTILALNLSKNFVIGERTLTWKVQGEMSRNRTPVFIDHQANTSYTDAFQANTNAIFRYNKDLTFRFWIWANFYRNQFAGSATFGSSILGTESHVSYNLKRLTVASSINFTSNNTADYITNLAIWNAFISYRLSKSEQFEIKLSANDILNMNEGIRNFVTSSVIGFRTSNRIRQFMIVSLAYYPRFFGKSNKK